MNNYNLGIVFVVTLLYFFVEMGGGLYFISLSDLGMNLPFSRYDSLCPTGS
jgi:hypothetical protein